MLDIRPPDAHDPTGSGLPPLLVDGSQVVGAALALIAIMIAVIAVRRADQGLLRERRAQHELEVLRGMAEANLQPDDLHSLAIHAAALHMIPGHADFPLLRAALDIRSIDTAREEYEVLYPNAPAVDGDLVDFDRLRPLIADGTFWREWNNAVALRVGERQTWPRALRAWARQKLAASIEVVRRRVNRR